MCLDGENDFGIQVNDEGMVDQPTRGPAQRAGIAVGDRVAAYKIGIGERKLWKPRCHESINQYCDSLVTLQVKPWHELSGLPRTRKIFITKKKV